MQILESDQRSIFTGGKPADFIWQAIDLIFPPFCCNCSRIGFELCPDCFLQIELLDQSQFCKICGGKKHVGNNCTTLGIYYDQIHSWGYYDGPLKRVVQKIKYQRGLGLARYLIPYIREFITFWFDQIELITPLPLGVKRERERGYNQTSLFAQPLARDLGINYQPGVVERVRETISQVGLSAVERQDNIRDAFQADEKIVKGLNVLLIDDITTTGATINECAKALKMAGAATVSCFTVAKAINKI